MKNRKFKIETGQDIAFSFPPDKPRQARNWIHVNIGQYEANRLRALAQCYGLEFRTFCEMAIRRAAHKLKDHLNLSAWDAVNIPQKRRMKMGRRYRETMARVFRLYSGDRN